MKSFFFFCKRIYKIFLSFTVCDINFVFWMKNLNLNKYFKINGICVAHGRCHLAACCLFIGYVITLVAAWVYSLLRIWSWGTQRSEAWSRTGEGALHSVNGCGWGWPLFTGSGPICNSRPVICYILSEDCPDWWKRKLRSLFEDDLLRLPSSWTFEESTFPMYLFLTIRVICFCFWLKRGIKPIIRPAQGWLSYLHSTMCQRMDHWAQRFWIHS